MKANTEAKKFLKQLQGESHAMLVSRAIPFIPRKEWQAIKIQQPEMSVYSATMIAATLKSRAELIQLVYNTVAEAWNWNGRLIHPKGGK